MADLTDLRWGPYPPTFPPRHQTALTGTRTATTAAVPTAACPVGPFGLYSRTQVRTQRTCPCCGDGFLLPHFPEAGAPRAATRDPRGARAVCDVHAHVERRRELRVGGVVRLLHLARRT